MILQAIESAVKTARFEQLEGLVGVVLDSETFDRAEAEYTLRYGRSPLPTADGLPVLTCNGVTRVIRESK